MSCPFLNKFSFKFLSRYSGTLLNNYANKCPFMNRNLSTFNSDSTEGTTVQRATDILPPKGIFFFF